MDLLRRMLEALRNPLVLISAVTLGSVVVLAGGSLWCFEGWMVALVVALVVVLLGLMALLVWMLLQQDRDRRLERGTEDEEVSAAERSREEERQALASLEDRFRRALNEIKRTQRGPRGIYQNPWYLVIGETGSGKSALIAASGLEMPAKFEGSLGRGPTGNCEWWIMNEAVLLDTAGRYAQALDPSTRKEWRRLLRLVRKSRPKRPINGIVLALPVTSLLGRDDATLVEMAKELRRRVNEITDSLGVDAPIYVAITKADRVDGFLETVRSLPPNRLQEAIGWTNPERRVANFEEHVAEGLAQVRERLDGFLPELVMREADPLRRARLFLFPQTFAELSRAVTTVLGQLFQRSVTEETPFLRGIYLTSCAQEGQTLSPLLDEIGHGWAHAHVASDGRPAAHFVRDVFREIVVDPEEAGLARRTGRLGPIGTRVVLGAGAALALGALVTLATSAVLNFRAIGRLSDDAASALAASSNLAIVTELRHRIASELENSGRFFHRAGLFGTTRRGIAGAIDAFLWSFEEEFERPTKNNLKGIVERADPRAFAALADLALDVSYLETRGAAGPETRPALWQYAEIRGRETDERDFHEGYDAFVAWLGDDWVRSRVKMERELLQRVSGQLLSIEQLERWGETNSDRYPPVRYTDVGVPAPAGAGEPTEVPGPYTRRAWESLVRGLIHGVETTGGTAPSSVETFRRTYLERYDQSWRRYLMGTPLPPRQEDEVLASPYLELLEQIHANATADLGRDETPAWIELLEEVHRTEPDEGEEQGAPWTRYRAALQRVSEEVAAAKMDAGDALALARDPVPFESATQVVREIVPKGRDPRAADQLRKILAMPILDGFSAVLDAAIVEIDSRWYDQIASRYKGNLTVSELNDLYHPKTGSLAEFRKEYLDPFVAGGDSRLRFEGRQLELGPEFSAWLDSAGRFQRVFASGFGGPARVNVRLEPIPSRVLGARGLHVTQRQLRVECAEPHFFSYQAGSRLKSHRFTWTPDCQEVSLRVWVGTHPGDQRELSPPVERSGGLDAFPSFAASGLAGEGCTPGRTELTWRFDDPRTGAQILVGYKLREGCEIFDLAHRDPPDSMRN